MIPTKSQRARLAIALSIGVAYFWLTHGVNALSDPRKGAGDFAWPLSAARAVLTGHDPYLTTTKFFYPYPTAFFALPFTPLEPRLAGEVMVGLGCAALAFVVTRSAWWPLIMFLSGPALQVAVSVQLTPWLVAASLVPACLGLLVIKPTVAVGLLGRQTAVRALVYAAIGGGVLLALSFALDIHWLAHWRATIRAEPDTMQYTAPILSWVGMPLGLALFRWRDPDARLILGLACVPQNAFFYDQLPLLLVARTRVQMLVLTFCSVLAMAVALHATIDRHTPATTSAGLLPFVVMGIYYPALVMVLRRAA